MILKTKEFQTTANKILVALGTDKAAGNLELFTANNFLYMNVTNKEFYVSVKFPVESELESRTVVDAVSFLDLISGITAETFELNVTERYLTIKWGKSVYKLETIYENDRLMELPTIEADQVTVSMSIGNDVLKSILDVNAKEIAKAKSVDISELQKLYYIDETCCFTFTTGACLNKFQLEKPVKMLLTDRIVKLFKLFDTDVSFYMGYKEGVGGDPLTIVCFMAGDTKVSAIINCADILLTKISAPLNATKKFIDDKYDYSVVVSTYALNGAVQRLSKFTKNSVEKIGAFVKAVMHITKDSITIQDQFDNTEVIPVENESIIEAPYDMTVNLNDLKAILDATKLEHVTLNCGNHHAAIITRGQVSNLVKEF